MGPLIFYLLDPNKSQLHQVPPFPSRHHVCTKFGDHSFNPFSSYHGELKSSATATVTLLYSVSMELDK